MKLNKIKSIIKEALVKEYIKKFKTNPDTFYEAENQLFTERKLAGGKHGIRCKCDGTHGTSSPTGLCSVFCCGVGSTVC